MYCIFSIQIIAHRLRFLFLQTKLKAEKNHQFFYSISYLKKNFDQHNTEQAKEIYFQILDEEQKNGMPNDILEKVRKEFENRYEKINWIEYCDSLPFNESALALYEWSPIAEELKTLDKKIVLNSMILKWDNIAKEFKNLINF